MTFNRFRKLTKDIVEENRDLTPKLIKMKMSNLGSTTKSLQSKISWLGLKLWPVGGGQSEKQRK